METNKNKKKIIRIAVIFLLILLLITYIGYSYYLKNNGKVALRNEFFDKLKKSDFAFFMEHPVYTKIAEKLNQENYESNSALKIASTMENNMFSQLDLSKFELNHQLVRNQSEKAYFNQLEARYAGNHLLTLSSIENEGQFAVKSDEIVNRYVGMNKKNTQKVVNELWESQVDLSSEKKLKNFLLDRETIDFSKIAKSSSLATYVKILKENIGEGSFSKKENVIVTLDSEQVSTTEYAVELSQKQVSQLWNQLSESLSSDQDFVKELIVSQVQDFEKEETGILDYSDNENITSVPGEENNFNTSINIWGENTATENNTVANEAILTNNVVENNTITNNTVEQNVVENTVVISNSVNVNNTTEEPATNHTVIENNTQEQTVEQVVTPNESEIPVVQPANQTAENVVQEEENLRTQGFISVNEETGEDFSEGENFIVGENYEETVKNIQKLIQNIDWSSYCLSGAKANCSQEELIEIWQGILKKKVEENSGLIIKMYVSDDKMVKLNFEFLQTQESFDFEIVSKTDHEKYLLFTTLTGKEENANGYHISLYKKNDDAVTKTKINMNKIHKNKINQKTNIDLETKGTLNAKRYTTTADVVYSDKDGEFKVTLDHTLSFDVEAEIETLNSDNCLFLDTLSKEELLPTRDVIKQKTMEVLREKNRNLNIIDISNSNSVVQQIEQPDIAAETEEREQVRQILIQTLTNKMKEYLDNGINLKLEDLEGLEIPGYEVNLSISSNLAIITVNGYRFNLDSEFHLSDS